MPATPYPSIKEKLNYGLKIVNISPVLVYIKKGALSLVCLYFVLFSFLEVHSLVFLENNNATFTGDRDNLSWSNAQGALQLQGNNTSGVYTSLVKDATSTATWNSINYEPKSPYGKELPTNQTTETAYDFDEVSMVNNAGYWRYNETTGTSIADSSGQGNTANCTGTSCPTTTNTATTAKFNNARNFDGINDFYTTSNGNSVRNQSIVSFSTWIRPETITGIRTIYQESSPNINLSRFSTEVINGGLRFRVRDDDINPVDIFLTGPIFTVNTWYHIAIIFNADTDTHRLYINGALFQNINLNLTPFENALPALLPRIGQHSNLPNEIFDGQIDETAIFFGRELTAATVFDMYLRGATSLRLQVRSCDDPACVGENFVGPDGLTTSFYSDAINTSNALPNFALTNIVTPINRYFQFQFTFARDTRNLNLQVRIQNNNIDYNFASPSPSLAFVVRNSTDTANTNTCNLGNATTTTLASCSYRLKVSTNSASGYRIFVQTSGSLTASGTITNALAGSGGGGGNLIDGTTTGTERYGALIDPGSITGSGSITRNTVFDAGAINSVAFNGTSNQLMLTATGTNNPAGIDTTNTSLITHNLNISPSTSAGVYTQSVIYTVVANF